MVATRGRIRRQHLEALPLDPHLLAHVFGHLQLCYGPEALESASAVCRSWRDRATDSAHIDEIADACIGELRSGDKPYRFDRPHDAVFLPNGDLCVADCDNFRLHIVSRDGYYVRDVRLDGGTSCPTGVASCGEYIYVVEHGAHRLSKLRRSSVCTHHSEFSSPTATKRIASIGSWGGGDGEMRHPWGVTVALKRVFVTDQGNDRVCVFSAEKLSYLFSFGSSGGGRDGFREPRGLAAHLDTLYVADSLNHRIQLFSLSEVANDVVVPKGSIGGGRSGLRGRFDLPSGLCVANERLYVSELGNERVQVLSLDGLPMQLVKCDGPVSGICADDEHICATKLEGDHAITVWRLTPPPPWEH